MLTFIKFFDLVPDTEDVKKIVANTEGELSNEGLVELKEELEAQRVVEEEEESKIEWYFLRYQQNFIRIGKYGSKFRMFWKSISGNA